MSVSNHSRFRAGQGKLTPFSVAFAAALACLPDLLAAPVNTYASAIALEELAIAAAAGAQPSPPRGFIATGSTFRCSA
jgi:hypothetical protein